MAIRAVESSSALIGAGMTVALSPREAFTQSIGRLSAT